MAIDDNKNKKGIILGKNTKDNVPKARQKVLLPTLKEQQRYVVYRIVFPNNFYTSDFKYCHDQIIAKCNSSLGLFDGAKAGLMSAKFSEKNKKGIIRVENKYVAKLKICLGLIKILDLKIDGKNVQINVIIDSEYTTGLLNKAEDKMNA